MIEFYQSLPRQGPGSRLETLKALEYTGLLTAKDLQIADIGCGTGAQTLTLAEALDGKIMAIDLFPRFLDKLNEKARQKGLQNRIVTDEQSMDNLPYAPDSFDLIWSEGAIYIMGFEQGVKAWQKFLKTDGYLIVSEISWFSNTRPAELEKYWLEEYPQMNTVEHKIDVLEKSGDSVIKTFRLPDYCWLEEYYTPIRQHFKGFSQKHRENAHASQLIDALKEEIRIYEKYREYFGYAFFIAQKS